MLKLFSPLVGEKESGLLTSPLSTGLQYRVSIVAGDGITGDNDGHRLHQSSGGGFSAAAAVANGKATVGEGGQEVVIDEKIITSSSSTVASCPV